MEENFPILISQKPLKPEFKRLEKIAITSDDFTIGRSEKHSVDIKLLSISRNHCRIFKSKDDWYIEDSSTNGIFVNGIRLGKGTTRKLSHEDIIVLVLNDDFVYTFHYPQDDFEIPRKRIKLENNHHDDIINNVRVKFEESQNFELQHIEHKIKNAKNLQTTSLIMKDQLQLDMNKKVQQLEKDFATQIENLKGEKNEVEKQKALLIAERDAQLASVRQEMEGKINELMEQIQKLNETESELVNENNALKSRLLKEREDFLAELNRESSSKQDLLDKLEAKLKEQEEIRQKEREELEAMLRKETELLRIAKEKELKELEELKKQREAELELELINLKNNLEERVQQAEQERLKAEQMLNEQMEQRKKLTDEEKAKMELIIQEREEIEKKLIEAQASAEKSIENLKARVAERETELAALAADRIQKQVEQSSEVINTLQEQLEKVKSQLQAVETEKKTLLESIGDVAGEGSSTSKQSTLAEVGELMESELQCSVCAELFVAATTLNCAHTFCKYCITMWKKKKKDCPICRAPITSECKSLVLDSFIEKMVQNLTEDMKKKRQELLKSREELESELACQLSVGTSRRSFSYDESDYNSDSEFLEEEEEYEDDYYDIYWTRGRRIYDTTSDSGSDNDDDLDASSGEVTGAGDAAAGAGDATNAGASVPNTADAGRADGHAGARRRGTVPGIPGSYYGGYGRCYSCGARGHWAPGCPFR